MSESLAAGTKRPPVTELRVSWTIPRVEVDGSGLAVMPGVFPETTAGRFQLRAYGHWSESPGHWLFLDLHDHGRSASDLHLILRWTLTPEEPPDHIKGASAAIGGAQGLLAMLEQHLSGPAGLADVSIEYEAPPGPFHDLLRPLARGGRAVSAGGVRFETSARGWGVAEGTARGVSWMYFMDASFGIYVNVLADLQLRPGRDVFSIADAACWSVVLELARSQAGGT